MEAATASARNIDQRGVDQRIRRGVLIFAFGLVLGVTLVKLGVPAPLRLLLVVPFFGGSMLVAMGLFRL